MSLYMLIKIRMMQHIEETKVQYKNLDTCPFITTKAFTE